MGHPSLKAFRRHVEDGSPIPEGLSFGMLTYLTHPPRPFVRPWGMTEATQTCVRQPVLMTDLSLSRGTEAKEER